MIGLLFAVLSQRLQTSFAVLERKDVEAKIAAVKSSLAADLETIRGQTRDWAFWDDLYAFMADAPTLSAGVATFPDNAADAEALVSKADNAIYRAKDAGRDRVESA